MGEDLEEEPGAPVRCLEPMCGDRATGGLPWCRAHRKGKGRAIRLAAELVARERELAAIAEQGPRAVDVHGSRARELLDLLEVRGPLGLWTLAQALDVSEEAALVYLTALEREKLVARADEGMMDLAPGERRARELVERAAG